jgi:hypothetical protein
MWMLRVLRKLFVLLLRFIWFLLRPIVWAMVIFLIAWSLRVAVMADIFERLGIGELWLWP